MRACRDFCARSARSEQTSFKSCVLTITMSGLARASSLKAKQPNRLASKLNSRHRKASVVKNASSKKRKREVESVDSLPWKRMSSRYFSSEAFGEEGGMLEIDEVSDVEVVYEETDGGRVAKFRVRNFWDEAELS